MGTLHDGSVIHQRGGPPLGHVGQGSEELGAMGTDVGIEQRCDALRWRDGKTSIRSHRNGQTSSDERLEDWLSGHQ